MNGQTNEWMTHFRHGWEHKDHTTQLSRQETFKCAPLELPALKNRGKSRLSRTRPWNGDLKMRIQQNLMWGFVGEGSWRQPKQSRTVLCIRGVWKFHSYLIELLPSQLCNMASLLWKTGRRMIKTANVSTNKKSCWRCGEEGILLHCWWDCKKFPYCFLLWPHQFTMCEVCSVIFHIFKEVCNHHHYPLCWTFQEPPK